MANKEIVLLSIDNATRNIGWALFRGALLEESGQITIKGKGDSDSRICEYFRSMSELVGQKKPDSAAIERPFMGNKSSGPALLEYMGILKLILQTTKIPFELVAVPTAKKAVTGDGRASKEQVMEAISKIYHFNPKTDNEADAVAVGHAVLHRNK